MRRRPASSLAPALLFLFVAAGSLVAYRFGVFDSWQEKLFDRLYTRHAPSQNIVIIAIDDDSLAAIGQWPWRRAVFGQALDKLHDARAIGIDVSFSEPSRFGAADDRALRDALARIPSSTPVVLPIQLSPRGKVAATPLPDLASLAQQGFVNLPLDADSVSRRASVLEGNYPSFAALLAASLPSYSPPEGEYRIEYQGPKGTFLTLPFIDLLEGRIPPRTLEGALVLIGATATDLHDTVATPFGTLPGVEAHANELETLARGAHLREVPFPLGALMILLLAALASAMVARIGRLWQLLLALSGVWLAFNALGIVAFGQGVLVPLLYLNASFLASAGLSIARAYAAESQERARIRTAFQYYLPPDVIEELLAHPEKLALGGERRKATILFSDIAGFTTLSEALSPQQLTGLMNEYLTAMTDIILEERGLVDKYIGDAIMAFWGAPVENPRQAADSCRAAMRMRSALAELNARWREQGLPELGIRIGIATGEVVVGNMGSARRFNYTAMGDEVNLASRLESLNKAYGTSIIVSQSTYEEAKDDTALYFRRLGKVRVKGKREARTIYELLPGAPTTLQERQHAAFERGLLAYEHGHWGEAIRHFAEALALGEDGPSSALLQRAEAHREKPPASWDGVHTFDTK